MSSKSGADIIITTAVIIIHHGIYENTKHITDNTSHLCSDYVLAQISHILFLVIHLLFCYFHNKREAQQYKIIISVSHHVFSACLSSC